MKAAVLEKPYNFNIKEVNMPANKEGWVLIKVMAAGICGSDIHYYTGEIPLQKETIRGHEIAGVVASSDSVKYPKGTPVVVNCIVGCNKCDECNRGDFNLCKELKFIGAEYAGGFAEYVSVPEENLYPFNSNLITFECAALTDCVAVALHGVRKVALQKQERVAIIGDGTIGLFLVQLAYVHGAKEIVLIGKHQKNLEIGSKTGATSLINISGLDSDSVIGKVGRNDFDVVFEAVGGTRPPFKMALDLIKSNGRVGILGVTNASNIDVPWLDLILKEKSLIGSMGYGKSNNNDETRESITLMEKSKVLPSLLITDHLPLEDIKNGFELMLNKKASGTIKVIIAN